MFDFLSFAIVLVAVVLAVVFAGIKVVPQGQQWTVERFGRYTVTLQPGLSLIVPFIDRIGHKISVMEQVLNVEKQTVISKDNALITADGVVFYRVDDTAKAAYQVANLRSAIQNLTTTNLRSVLGSMELDYMLSNRETINSKLLTAVDEATAPWGVKVTRIEISALDMEPALQEAMNLQMTAERHRRAAVTKADGEREAEILKAKGSQEAAILRAQGEKAAAVLLAEAREREAQAEALATEAVSNAINAGNAQALQYFLGLKYIEAIKTIGEADSSKLVLMPLEAGGLTGAVAGVAELLKSGTPR